MKSGTCTVFKAVTCHVLRDDSMISSSVKHVVHILLTTSHTLTLGLLPMPSTPTI